MSTPYFIALLYITSHYTTSHNITSHHTTHPTTSHHNSPHKHAPSHAAAVCWQEETNTPFETVPERTTSYIFILEGYTTLCWLFRTASFDKPVVSDIILLITSFHLGFSALLFQNFICVCENEFGIDTIFLNIKTIFRWHEFYFLRCTCKWSPYRTYLRASLYCIKMT